MQNCALSLVIKNNMKKLFSLLFLLVGGIIVFSCTSEKKPASHAEFVSGLTSSDTAEVKQLCEQFLNTMKAGDKDAAFSLLHSIDENGNVTDPTRESLAKLSTQFSLFPVKDFHLKDLKIGTEKDNICSYSIVFNVDSEGKESAISFGFCPVKVNGKWYITVRNASAKLAD